MKIMTKNEYQAYLKECANRWYTDKSYTKEKFDADLDSVEILDFDLSNFKLDPEIEKWINILFKEEDIDRNGNLMLRGFSRGEMIDVEKLKLHYGEYGRSLSLWAYSDEEMLLYTYCEGDTTLTLLNNPEIYKKNKHEMLEWYKECT